MKLSNEDLKIVERASRDEKKWRYLRFLDLVFWGSVLFGGFWLIKQPGFHDSKLLHMISIGMGAIGATQLGGLKQRWHNKERQLLLRITSNISQPSG